MSDTNIDVFNDFIGKSNESKKTSAHAKHSGDLQFEDKSPRRIPMSIYLKPTIITAVEKMAKKHGVSNSKVIEKILESSLSTP
jgi:hypothetical protein